MEHEKQLAEMIGKFQYKGEELFVYATQFQDPEALSPIALLVQGSDGILYSMPTMTPRHKSLVEVGPYECMIRNYSEYEGWSEILYQAGIVSKPLWRLQIGPFGAPANIVTVYGMEGGPTKEEA